MTTHRPLRVFLCHSSNDKPAVRDLYQQLRTQPWIEPWLDEEELYPGQDWNMEIEKAVESADAIIVCLSRNSISKEGYVQRELRIVLDFADYKPEGTLYIIPVRLEECEPPRRLRPWQYADYFEGSRERGFQRLLISLKRRATSLGLEIDQPESKENQVYPGNMKAVSHKEMSLEEQKLSSGMAKTIQDNKSQLINLYYPNKFGTIILSSLEEVIGKNALNSVLRLSGLTHYINKYPPDNLNREFSFAEFSALGSALEKTYGPKGGRGLAHRAGRVTFSYALRNFGALAGAADLAFVNLPVPSKIRIGLPAMAKIFSQLSDQTTAVEERDSEWIWTIHKCPCCWERQGEDKPVCSMAVGLLQESLSWVSGGKAFRVNEVKCVAAGDQICEFLISKEPNS
jgi:predicted hydrocarbon binding protein